MLIRPGQRVLQIPGHYRVSARRGSVGGGGPLLTDLIEYWDLSEASGNRVGGYAGLVLSDTGGVTQAAGVGGGQYAAEFDGATQYLSRAYDGTLQLPASGDFTIALWMYCASVSGTRYFGGNDTAGVGMGFRTFNAYISSTLSGSGGGSSSAEQAPLAATTWKFVVLQYTQSARTFRASINGGAFDGYGTITGGPGQASNDWTLGATPAIAGWWGGRMQSLGYWHRLLTSDERTWLYNSGSAARLYTDVAAWGGP